jgi:hypothetical protein
MNVRRIRLDLRQFAARLGCDTAAAFPGITIQSWKHLLATGLTRPSARRPEEAVRFHSIAMTILWEIFVVRLAIEPITPSKSLTIEERCYLWPIMSSWNPRP